MMLKKYSVILLMAACVLITACSRKPDAIDSKNNAIYLANYHGKWLVVNYWAKWCQPCLKELPDLDNLAQKDAAEIAVLGVSFDPLSKEEVNQFASQLNLHFPMLMTFPLARFGIHDIPALPLTLIIDPKGKLHATLHGPQTQASLLAAMGMQ